MAKNRHRSVQGTRGFDRTERLNELVARLLAEELQRFQDTRLDWVTISGVETDRDLNRAKVFVSGESVDAETLEVLGEYRVRLQRAINEGSRLRRVPELVFLLDETSRSAARIESILLRLRTGEGNKEYLYNDAGSASHP